MKKQTSADTATNADPRLAAVAEGFASLRQAQQFLDVGRSKLYEMMDKEGLAFASFGRRRKIPWVELRKFAADRLQTS